jgi:hypothetical protein
MQPKGGRKIPSLGPERGLVHGLTGARVGQQTNFLSLEAIFWPRPRNGLVRGGTMRERAMGSKKFLVGPVSRGEQ